MRAAYLISATLLLIIATGAGVAAYKLSDPDMPAAETITRLVALDQGWSDAERGQYHYTPQGTLLLPLSWLKAMDRGFFTSKKLLAPEVLVGLREITDPVAPGQKWNDAGLPVGWTVDRWASPANPNGPRLAKVGFNCAACHTGQINYHGTGILIEGGGSLHDAGALQAMIGKAVLATEWLPWKRSRFLDAVVAETGQTQNQVSADLDHAASVAWQGVKQSLMRPQYEPEGYGRLDALQRIANTVFADDLSEPSNNQRGNGAVKFPFLWDIWRLDWVQYNAAVRQPMVRNVGEALGVRAETNLVDPATGQTNPEPARWYSSVNVQNLQWMEEALQRLRPPSWPASILGPINKDLSARGRGLFDTHCAGCHGIKVDQTVQPVEWRVTEIPVEKIGTSPNTAVNFVEHSYSGAKLGKGTLHAADALALVTEKVKENRYAALGLTPEQQAAADGFGRKNIVVGDKSVYKARPLVGIWATPPYLHNGSVPTLRDLLSIDRPASFVVGTREYDPENVGYSTKAFPGNQVFDTSTPGNSNLGHWFANDARPGTIGPALTVSDRMALIEYLKDASYDNYPCTDATTGAKLTGAICGQQATKN